MLEKPDIVKAVKKLESNYQTGKTEKELRGIVNLWYEKFKNLSKRTWESMIEEIIDNLTFRQKRLPEVNEIWKVYYELQEREIESIEIAYNCEKCMDTGIRAYREDGVVHIRACICKTGAAIYRGNPEIDFYDENKTEYPIHRPGKPFGGHLPEGESYRLAQEVCGKESIMWGFLESLKKGEMTSRHAVDALGYAAKKKMDNTQPERKEYDEELPF
ncbi:MAG: hypothetical protein ABEK36_04050 [Candidatus Aenigmatarchaeota archaeon]